MDEGGHDLSAFLLIRDEEISLVTLEGFAVRSRHGVDRRRGTGRLASFHLLSFVQCFLETLFDLAGFVQPCPDIVDEYTALGDEESWEDKSKERREAQI